jgi:cytochrome c-type biogenesis protein CcmH
MLVSDCECEAAAQMKDFIQEKLDSGLKPDEILDILVKTYGEKILAEPRREGFGLVAWVTPFLALLLGLFIVAFLIKTWTTRRRVEIKPSSGASSTQKRYRKKIEEELKKWT